MMVEEVQEDQLMTSILEIPKSNFGKNLEIEGLQKEESSGREGGLKEEGQPSQE
jgi:hypothetical protein